MTAVNRAARSMGISRGRSDAVDAERPLLTGRRELLERVEHLLNGRRRTMLGIVGPPGAGKSTIAGWLESAVNARHGTDPLLVAQVPMDGFHLSNARLAELGRADRKGAPDTFDVEGYAALLACVRDGGDKVLRAPSFSRVLEEPVPGTHVIPPSVRLVISEGNYLLLEEGGWAKVGAVLDETWFVTVDPAVVRERLIRRQRAGGRSAAAAVDWVERSDLANLRAVNRSSTRADVLVRIAGGVFGGGFGSGLDGG